MVETAMTNGYSIPLTSPRLAFTAAFELRSLLLSRRSPWPLLASRLRGNSNLLASLNSGVHDTSSSCELQCFG